MAATARKLAAILFADIAGFSRLMERNESLTFARLHRLEHEVTHPMVAEHGGRVVKTTGDGFFAEFASSTAAVHCAIAMQKAIVALESGQADIDRIRFRMGINIGDVIVDEQDLLGDGVNIAARLEPLAPADGICISHAVFDQLRDDLGVTFADAGEQHLKNISRPIRAFTTCLSEPAGLPAPAAPASAPGDIRRLSIVVLPFVNMGADPGQQYFADGITEDITIQLSKIRNSFVIGRNTAFSYKEKTPDLNKIGKELGVRYALLGSVERLDDGVDTRVRLVDTLSGATLWEDTIEVDKAGIRNIRQEVVTRMTMALNLQLIAAEAKRSWAGSSGDMEAGDLAMQGRAQYYRRPTQENLALVLQLYDRALNLQPDNQTALVGRALILIEQSFGWPLQDEQLQSRLAEADRALIAAIAIDRRDAEAHYVLSRCRQMQGRIAAAIAEAEMALDLNPNHVEATAWRGLLFVFDGQPECALDPLRKALCQSPRDPMRWMRMFWLCTAHTNMGQYTEAIRWCEKAIAINPGWWGTSSYQAAAYAMLGDVDNAARAKAKLLALHPDFHVHYFNGSAFSPNPEFLQRLDQYYYAGLRKAGLPM